MPKFTAFDTVCPTCRADKTQRIYRVWHQYNYKKRAMIDIFCEHVAKQFQSLNSDVTLGDEALNWSPDDAYRLLGLMDDHDLVVTAPCAGCGREIHYRTTRDRGKRRTWTGGYSGFWPPLTGVCSRECFNVYYARDARDKRGPRPELMCGRCGEKFKGRKDAQYCSTRCRVAAHRANSGYENHVSGRVGRSSLTEA